MAIVKYNSGALAKAPGATHPAKAAKHAVKKHAAKKHAAKHAEKHAAKKHAKKAAKESGSKSASAQLMTGDSGAELSRAFHHLQRAAAVISLLEGESGGDLRTLMDDGVAMYQEASANASKTSAKCATGLLRAAEHLAMAGLYVARRGFRVEVKMPSHKQVGKLREELGPRLAGAGASRNGKRVAEMARELLRRARGAEEDAHLEFELVTAAEGLCAALEAGL